MEEKSLPALFAVAFTLTLLAEVALLVGPSIAAIVEAEPVVPADSVVLALAVAASALLVSMHDLSFLSSLLELLSSQHSDRMTFWRSLQPFLAFLKVTNFTGRACLPSSCPSPHSPQPIDVLQLCDGLAIPCNPDAISR